MMGICPVCILEPCRCGDAEATALASLSADQTAQTTAPTTELAHWWSQCRKVYDQREGDARHEYALRRLVTAAQAEVTTNPIQPSASVEQAFSDYNGAVRELHEAEAAGQSFVDFSRIVATRHALIDAVRSDALAAHHGAELAAVLTIPEVAATETASGCECHPRFVADGPRPMSAPTFDESGDYPSDETLDAIASWPWAILNDGFDFVKAAWHWDDWAGHELRPYEREMVHAEEGEKYLRLATGGWSGNESIVGAMRNNMAMQTRWCVSASGGLHIYEYMPLAEDQPTTKVSSSTAASAWMLGSRCAR